MRWMYAAPFAILLLAWAQSEPEKPAGPPVLENSGKPMAPQFQCTEDDIHGFGLSCTEEEPCPVYLELSAIEPVGAQIVAVGNLHSGTATLYSILLSSVDGGKTWREAFERVRGASLDRILFVDFEHGWITGHSVQPLARDPFVLITADGGKTWRRQAVFEDTKFGSIQHFWFESRNNGSLVFDRGQSSEGPRYELYESATGGDNWMVREASDRPIRIKRMPLETGNADWRIRADAATKSNRIEKRQGTRWTSIASFAVQIGVCKPPPAKEPEPPPEITPEQSQPQPANKGTLSLQELRGDPKRPKK